MGLRMLGLSEGLAVRLVDVGLSEGISDGIVDVASLEEFSLNRMRHRF